MRNTRKTGRLLTLLMAVLMVVSCIVALPAAAEAEASSVTKLWGHDFSTFGTVTNAQLKEGYFSANDTFALDVSGTGATSLSGGMFALGGASYIRNTETTGANPNKDFFNLMYGFYDGYNTVNSKYFMELDFIKMKDGGLGTTGSIAAKVDSDASWRYYDENDQLVEGSGALYTDFGGQNGNSFIFCKAGGQTAPLLDVAANGMVYTRDNRAASYADVLSYGGVYYINEQGEKVYLPSDASVTNLNLGDRCIGDPSKAYQLETGVTYRLGVSFRVAGVGTDGKNTIVATVYIKKAGAVNWETCIGSTTYYYYPIGYNNYAGATAANDCIQFNDTSYAFKIGGKWEIYSYTCDGTNHVNVISKANPIDETRHSSTCIDCGKTWDERIVDGIRYLGTAYGNKCEGTYMVWLPTDGIGAPFADSEYTTLGAGHTYSTTNGKCSVCGEYSFLDGFEGADLKVEYGTKETAKPAYNAEEKSWSWPGGGYMMIKNGMLDGTTMKPYVYSFDIKVDGAVVFDSTKTGRYWPLMTWQNSGDVNNYQNTYLSIGATGDTEEDDLYLILNGNYDTTKTIENAVHVFERGQWYNIAVAVNPAEPTLSVYVDGKYVGSVPNTKTVPNNTYTSTTMRMGVNSVTGRYYMQYNLRNIKLEKAETDTFYDIVPNNELFSFRYDRYQQASSEVGGKSTHCIGTFVKSTLAPTNIYTLEDGTVFGMVENTGYRQFSLYSNTENNKYVLSDKRYELKLSVAVPDTVTLPSNGANLIRLSKHLDHVKSENLKYSGDGQYKAYVKGIGDCLLYKKDGVTPLTFIRTFTNGIPESFSEIRMIVDEGKNTYTVYVDGALAYYLDSNGDPQPAKDLTMRLSASSGSASITGKTYGQITREDIVAAGFTISTDGMYDCHYARILRDVPSFALEEFKVTRIPDSDVEFIGVQERIDTENDLFDVRFVVGIDDVYVPGIGFQIEAFVNGESRGTEDVVVDYAYEAIMANGSPVYSYQFSEGAYLTAFRVVGIDLTNDASDIYSFKVTPYALDEEGEKVNVGASRVFKYNGQGVCVDNGRPKAFNPEDFAELTTAPVLLELKEKAESAAGDYADFFVYTRCSDPSGRYYVRYRFQYCYNTALTNKTDSSTNIESFRVVSAELVKLNSISESAISYTKIYSLLSSGEISLAVKEYEYGQSLNNDGTPKYGEDGVTPVMGNAIGDFCGGFHGDEHFVVVDGVDQLALKADGVAYTPGAVNAIVQCQTVTLDQTTLLDKWTQSAGSRGQFAKHQQTFTLTDNGMKIDRTVTWLVSDFVIDTAYPMMFTLLRVSDGQPICETVETFDANGVSLGKKTFELVNTTQSNELANANLRQVRFSSATSGVSGVAGFSLGANNQGVLNTPYIAYRKAPEGGTGDNKLYIPMTGSISVQVQYNEEGNTKTRSKTAEGEVWEISTYYDIDYTTPAN